MHARMANEARQDSNCVDPNPDNTLTDRMNIALNSSGPGYILSLCPSTQYIIEAPINFAFPDQEISTQGYPTDDTRATLIVNGPVANGTGQTTAIQGNCANCTGIRLRNIQINGTRQGAPPLNGGANIEMGGDNSGQLIEYVHSYDPRSWSCLHIAEGTFKCNNITIQNNDIGPCGSDAFQQWADGISVSCRNAVVRNNMINNPTDGGIVLFGSPGTLVENNTIWVETQMLLGGINMVDYEPWNGSFTDTIVRNNTIMGGFATQNATAGEKDGSNPYDVIIKIGIAMGPVTWFGPEYGTNVSANGTVENNQFTGAFSYAMAMASVSNFTVQNNVLIGNTSFIGAVGPNCTQGEPVPSPAPFVVDSAIVYGSNIQSNFETISNGSGLTCVFPPQGGDFWPFGGNPSNSTGTSTSSGGGGSSQSSPTSSPSNKSSHSGRSAGIAVGVILGLAAVVLLTWFIRRWAIRRNPERRPFSASRRSGYIRNLNKETF